MPFQKGNPAPKTAFKKGQVAWNKGKKLPYIPHPKQKGFTPWNKGKSSWSKGKHLSDEHKKKIGEANSVSLKGKIRTEKTKQKMSEVQFKRWSKIPKKTKRYHHIMDKKYKQWRSDVFQRDIWTCQTCGKKGVYLEPHHIKSYAHYPELRYNLDNGVTLCLDCHKLTNNYKGKRND